MARRAEFSERQYELAMNLELLSGAKAPLFSTPSQAAEKTLGYDVALVPAFPTVWSLVGYSSPPSGVIPGFGVLGHDSAPTFAASLFIQYKRPVEMRGTTAREAPLRAAAGVKRSLPYFRYGLAEEQLRVLLELSREVGDRAVVCYAAPAFVELADLHEMQVHSHVCANSNFLPLPNLDAVLGSATTAVSSDGRLPHVWTYGKAGHAGLLCSEPLAIESWQGSELWHRAVARAIEGGREVGPHVVDLARAIEGWEETFGAPVRDRWGGMPPPPGQARRLRFGQVHIESMAAFNLQNALRRQGIGWLLALARPEADDAMS